MNDKKILIVFHCLLLKSVTGFWDFPNEKDMNRMDIPKNPSDFFFVTIFRKAPAFKHGINDYFDHLCIFF
jgi:hypothetical protein